MAMTGPRAAPPPRLGEREEQILEAAAELFRRRGFVTTSLQDVADRVGLHKSTLYHYFPSKDDLLLRIVLDVSAELDRIAEEVDGLDVAPLERVSAYLRGLIALVIAQPAKTTVYREDLVSLSPDRRAEQLRHRVRRRDVFAELIARAQEAGAVSEVGEPRALAGLLIGAARGMVAACHPGRGPSDATASHMVLLLVRALGPGLPAESELARFHGPARDHA